MLQPVDVDNIFQYIYLAIEKNIIVYDDKGKFTETLVARMKRILNNTYEIFVSEKFLSEIQMENKLVNRFNREVFNNVVLDVIITPVTRDMKKDYIDLKGTIPTQALLSEIVLGTNKDRTEFILGSY